MALLNLHMTAKVTFWKVFFDITDVEEGYEYSRNCHIHAL